MAISETRTDRGKVTMEGLQEVTNALSNGTIPDTLRPPLPKIGVRNRRPKETLIAIISGTVKATNFKFGQNNNRVHPNKMSVIFLEKRERGRIQGLPKIFGYPLLSQE